ncbi:MAG: translation elongation factor Ts [Candidatus Berkelbacteria bacterium]
MTVSAKEIAELRAKTGIGMMECKKALVEADGDEARAMEILKKKGVAKSEKRADRETKNGIIESYVHSNNQIGVLIEVLAETDFVAKNDEFKEFAHDVALHIAAMNPTYLSEKDIPVAEVESRKAEFAEELKDSGKPAEIIAKIVDGKLQKFYSELCLMDQLYVKNDKMTITDLLNEKIAKIGEKIVISRFVRYQIGE